MKLKEEKTQRLLLSKEDSWVRPYFKKYRKLLVLVLFLGLMTFFSASALMFTSGFLISKSATRPYNLLIVYVPIVLTRAFGIGRPSFRYAERLGSHNWVLKMTSDLRLNLYSSLESQASQAKEKFQTGSILGVLAEDLEHIQNLYLRTIFPTIIGLILYVLIVIALGVFSLPFALLMLIILGAIVILIPLVSVAVNQARVYRRKHQRHLLYNDLTDSVLGVGDWQYSGRYEEFLSRYNEAEAGVRSEDAALNKYTRRQDLLIQLVFGLGIVAVLFWTSYYFGIKGNGGLNWVAAFVLAMFPLIDAFSPISQGVTELPMYEDSVQRLDALPPIPTDTGFVDEVPHVEVPKQVELNFEQLDFKYSEQGKVILADFNLQVQAGQTLAILGKSGTGKTTLTKILRGDLTPLAGQVTLNGQSVRDLTPMSAYIGVLNQDPHLFNTSLLNNVRLGNLNASDEEVEAAIEQAGLGPVVATLPEGVHTLVEEGGKRFSGGEQQRIALARILLQDVPVVVIDEPTIGLDPITERALLDTVFTVLKDKTIIWITHHLMSIEQADRIIFLEEGQIKMDGTPKELRDTNQHFNYLLSLDYN